MKKGDIPVVSFTGRELSSGRVFDTTSEAEAKKAGIYREGAIYRAIPVVVGSGDLIKGMENALENMGAGEEKVFRLSPAEAFGERSAELIRVIPMRDFTKNKLTPFQGMVLEINGMAGRVQTISGGRVRVDFNPELAGKEVEYKLKVERVLTKPQEIADAFLEKLFPMKDEAKKPRAKFSAESGVLEAWFDSEMPKELDVLKDVFAKTMKGGMPAVKEVKFLELVGVTRKPGAGEAEKGAAKEGMAKAGKEKAAEGAAKAAGKEMGAGAEGAKAPAAGKKQK
ncbi:MAG: peptidylprolyl isomerase [Candidatus Diapherotrites archaeon]